MLWGCLHMSEHLFGWFDVVCICAAFPWPCGDVSAKAVLVGIYASCIRSPGQWIGISL